MQISTKVFLSFLGVLAMVNLLWLDFEWLSDKREKLVDRLVVVEERLTPLRSAEQSFEGQASLVADVSKEEEIEVEPIRPPRSTSVPVSTGTIVKEVFIPLGSGATSSTEWVETGAQAYIDTSIYPSLAEAYFQGSIKGNSGVVFARLVQKNEGTVVPGSDISHNTPASSLKTSEKILLSSGNKLYVVQLRSEIGQEVFVENGRVRLVLR